MAIDPTTTQALAALRAAYPSTLAMIRALDLPQGTTYDLLAQRHDHVSWQAENAVRARIGLQPTLPPRLRLAPNQRLVTLRPPEQRDKRETLHCSASLHARLRRQRMAAGLTEEQFLTRLAELWDKEHTEVEEVPSA